MPMGALAAYRHFAAGCAILTCQLVPSELAMTPEVPQELHEFGTCLGIPNDRIGAPGKAVITGLLNLLTPLLNDPGGGLVKQLPGDTAFAPGVARGSQDAHMAERDTSSCNKRTLPSAFLLAS